MSILRAGTVVSIFWTLISGAYAADRFAEIRASLGPNEEIVMLDISAQEMFPLENTRDPADPKTALGQCFGIVHLDQKLSALQRDQKLFVSGPRDEAKIIQEKMMKAARGEAFEPISGFTSLSEFYQDESVRSILAESVKEIQKLHSIIGERNGFRASLENQVTTSETASPFTLPTLQSGAQAASEIAKNISLGKSLHLFVRDEASQVGHSVRVVGFIRDKETQQITKVITQDSNFPGQFKVLNHTADGQWNYPLTATTSAQPVVIAVVDDGTQSSAGQRLMTDLPRASIQIVHQEKSKPAQFRFECSNENPTRTELSGFIKAAGSRLGY